MSKVEDLRQEKNASAFFDLLRVEDPKEKKV